MALPLLLPITQSKPTQAATPPLKLTVVPLVLVQPKPKPDYDRDVLIPLHKAQAVKAAKDKAEANAKAVEAAKAAQAAQEAAQAAPVAVPEQVATPQARASYSAPTQVAGFVGSIGYSLPYGNCVNEPGVNNPGWGNPIDWPALYFAPHIGATVLFTFNHTGVVSGIYSNGDIEVRQQNAPGMPHRIPPSMVRGYR